MAAAIEDMSVSIAYISEQGVGARRIANSSRSTALQGADVVGKTVAGLLATAQEIETASTEVSRLGEDASRISDVVKAIKEIADQTNLLALNTAAAASLAQSIERVSSMSGENASAAQSPLGMAKDLEDRAREVRQAVDVFRF